MWNALNFGGFNFTSLCCTYYSSFFSEFQLVSFSKSFSHIAFENIEALWTLSHTKAMHPWCTVTLCLYYLADTLTEPLIFSASLLSAAPRQDLPRTSHSIKKIQILIVLNSHWILRHLLYIFIIWHTKFSWTINISYKNKVPSLFFNPVHFSSKSSTCRYVTVLVNIQQIHQAHTFHW
jgi:hypothetical protein